MAGIVKIKRKVDGRNNLRREYTNLAIFNEKIMRLCQYIYQNLRRGRERDFMMRYCLAAWIDFDNHLFISSVIPLMGVIDTFCEIKIF